MFAIDANLLVYAHNSGSALNDKAAFFLEKVMNETDENGNLFVCLTPQILTEFVHVITWQKLEQLLSIPEAAEIVQDYLDSGIKIVTQRETQMRTFLELLRSAATRRRIFDVFLAATLKDNGISGIYTVNVNDFIGLSFLKF